MCYLVREPRTEAERGGTTQPTSLHRLRPRWIAAVVAMLVGGLAVAALVIPPSTPPLMNAKDPAALAPVASRTPTVPTPTVVEQGSGPVDDGVPSATPVVKAGMGDCHHGL